MYQAKDGTLWLGSNGNGIYRRSTDEQGNETFTAYTTQHGLANNSVRGILEDDKGLLWIATYNGISRLHPNTGHITNYTRQDGLADTQFYWNAACNSTEGELYFGHLKEVYSPLNRPVFVKRKHNLLSAGADHIYPIIIVY